VIDVCMASAHIPFFMDGRPYAACRGGLRCIDGSFLYVLLGRTVGLVPAPAAGGAAAAAAAAAGPCDGGGGGDVQSGGGREAPLSGAPPPAVLMLDPWRDESLRAEWSWAMCLELLSTEGAEKLLRAGFEYARRLDEAGGLDVLRGDGAATASAATATAAAADTDTTAVATDGVPVAVGKQPVRRTVHLVADSTCCA
jgi:hypothetical protein